VANRKVAGRTRNQRYRYLLWGATDGVTEPVLEDAVEGGGGGAPSSPVTDPDNVQLLLNFNGTDETSTFTDESNAARTVYANVGSGPKHDTAQTKFGTASCRLGDSSPAYLYVDDDTQLHGNSQFTCEAWFRWSDTTTEGSYQALFGKRQPGLGHEWQLWHNNGSLQLIAYNSGAIVLSQVIAMTIANDIWYHFAVVRTTAGDWYAFQDGVALVDGASETSAPTQSSAPFVIGYDDGGNSRQFHGWVDGFRYVHNEALYTSGFTPSTSAPTV
jgi:hypothetical protein